MRNPRHSPYYAVEDYNLWKGDWELIDGLPYAMSPSPIIKHQHLAALLVTHINNEISNSNGSCKGYIVVTDVDWIVDNHTVLKPDLSIICGELGNFITQPPALIVEILSPSTALKDRNVKFEIYEEQGVPYYIMVNPETNHYDIYVLRDGKYVAENGTTSFKLPQGCNIALNIEDVLARFNN